MKIKIYGSSRGGKWTGNKSKIRGRSAHTDSLWPAFNLVGIKTAVVILSIATLVGFIVGAISIANTSTDNKTIKLLAMLCFFIMPKILQSLWNMNGITIVIFFLLLTGLCLFIISITLEMSRGKGSMLKYLILSGLLNLPFASYVLRAIIQVFREG